MRHVMRFSAAAIVCAISLASQAIAQTQAKLEVPAGELVVALKSLASQLDIELVYQPGQLRNMRTDGLQGTYSPQQATGILLQGTTLEVHTDASGAMVIAPPNTRSMAQSSATNTSGQPQPFGSGVLLAQAGGSPPAQAGTTDRPSTGLAEVVVTAQRRGENLQNVPISVNALTADQLKTMGASSSEDLNLVPSVVFNPSVAGGQVTIRGISGTNSGADEPGNATYIDGVYQYAPTSGLFQFNSVERIEILKGPQGTLFGRNTAGGVVQVITRDPTQEFTGEAGVEYANYETSRGNLYLNTPITDTLAMNVAAYGFDQNEGWGRNVFTGEEVHKGYGWGVRSKLKWEAPSGATDVVLSGLYNKDKPVASALGAIAPGTLDTAGRPSAGIYNTNSEMVQFRTAEQSTVAGTVHHDLGFARLTSISAYDTVDALVMTDADGTPAPILVGNLGNSYDNFTQEIQLQSNEGSRLQWIGGVFYMDARTSGLFIIGPNRTATRTWTRSYAAFGQATYALTEETKITAGLRTTTDRRRLVSGVIQLRREDSDPSWRLAVDHSFSEDVLGYVSYSRGFKGGVFNATTPDRPAAGPTSLDAYEVGVKSEAFDRRLRVNTAVFYYDYRDVQVQLFDENARGSYFAGAGTARTYGLDLDVVAEPVDNLTLTGGLSLLDTEFTSPTPAPCFAVPPPPTGGVIRIPGGCPLDGHRLPFSPKFTASVAANYLYETGVGPFDLAASYSHNAGFFVDPGNFDPTRAKAFDTVNTSVTWTSRTGGLNASIWGKNLLDERRIGGANLGTGAGTTVYPLAPRTYGVTFGVKF